MQGTACLTTFAYDFVLTSIEVMKVALIQENHAAGFGWCDVLILSSCEWPCILRCNIRNKRKKHIFENPTVVCFIVLRVENPVSFLNPMSENISEYLGKLVLS